MVKICIQFTVIHIHNIVLYNYYYGSDSAIYSTTLNDLF